MSIALQECDINIATRFFSCCEKTCKDNPHGCTKKFGLAGCEHCNKDVSQEDAEQLCKCLHKALLETHTASEVGESPWKRSKVYKRSDHVKRIAMAKEAWKDY